MSTVGYGDLTIAGGSDPETWRLLIGAIYMPVSFSIEFLMIKHFTF